MREGHIELDIEPESESESSEPLSKRRTRTSSASEIETSSRVSKDNKTSERQHTKTGLRKQSRSNDTNDNNQHQNQNFNSYYQREENENGNEKDRLQKKDKEKVSNLRLNFNIRFAGDGSINDLLNVWVGDRENVREFKRRIQLLRPSLASRRLRLIYLGRVLTDGTLLVPWTELLIRRQNSQLSQTETVTKVLNEAVSGAIGVVRGSYESAINSNNTNNNNNSGKKVGIDRNGSSRSSKGKSKEIEVDDHGSRDEGGDDLKVDDVDRDGYERNDGSEEVTVWLQCAVGEVIEEKDENEDGDPSTRNNNNDQSTPSSSSTPSQFRPLMGFDRLAEAGFSEEDIEQVRRQFHADHGIMIGDNHPGLTGGGGGGIGDHDEEEHARAMEEQWLEGLTSTQEGVDNVMGSQIYMTLFKGLCIGFFFPILPLFFFRMDVLNRRTQLAILSGTAINFLFGILQYTNS